MFNNHADGHTMKPTDLNHISSYSVEQKELIHKLVFLLQVSCLQQIPFAIDLISLTSCIYYNILMILVDDG